MGSKDLFEQYRLYYRKRRWGIGVLMIGLILTALFLLGQGAAGTSWPAVMHALEGVLMADSGRWNADDKIIILIRMPRLIMAMLTGAALAISGAVMQSITRNPLVSPFTVGVSAAATFGAAMFLLFGYLLGMVSQTGVMVSAFLTAVLCAGAVYRLAKKVGTSATTLVLIGIGANYIFSAATSALQFFAEEHKLAMIVDWTFGSFNSITWDEVSVVVVPVFLAIFYLQRQAQSLNAMIGGDDDVLATLGTNPEALRRRTGIAAILITALTVCFTGIIGFVGLVAPHIARMIVGNHHGYLLPFSAVIGAWLVLAADALGHWIIAPVVLPVGVVIAFLGVPLFMHLVLKQCNKAWE